MKGNYVTLSESEKNDLLNAKDNRKYKLIGHSFTPLKGVGKNYCKGCGLMALRNKFTQWCIDKGCRYDIHPQYLNARKRFTKINLR